MTASIARRRAALDRLSVQVQCSMKRMVHDVSDSNFTDRENLCGGRCGR